MDTTIISLESDHQRLQLVPALGGGIAAWDWHAAGNWIPIFRSWDRLTSDRFSLACFPLVPWSNRITQGGFEQDGVFYPIRPNRDGERYPIHGDGWLQSWRTVECMESRVRLELESHAFDGNPYHYVSAQTFTLLPAGFEIVLEVTHLGDKPLPYGLGLHPYFARNAATRLCWKTSGVWLSGDDPIPVMHSPDFPLGWDCNGPSALEGPLIDNCFTGWDGTASIAHPNRGLAVTMAATDCNGYGLLYRPPDLPYFCLEPVTHPIDAFHLPERPGLAVLASGQRLTLTTRFVVDEIQD